MKLLQQQNFILVCGCLLLVAGCASPSRYALHQDRGPDQPVDVDHIADAVPRIEEKSKYGNPNRYEVRGKYYNVMETSKGYREKGVASWYGKKFHGHRTSSGETYDMYAMTAAHKTLPLPTYVQVTNLENDRTVIVKVNDRGPFHDNRIIDLSYAAARKLRIGAKGTGLVEVTAIDPREFHQARKQPPALLASHPVHAQYKLFLQVGAFISEQNAEKLKRRLTRMIKPSQVHTNFAAEKNVYRVRIGPLASVEEADELSSQLSNKGIPSTQIVID